jgi:hypothetical protein
MSVYVPIAKSLIVYALQKFSGALVLRKNSGGLVLRKNSGAPGVK